MKKYWEKCCWVMTAVILLTGLQIPAAFAKDNSYFGWESNPKVVTRENAAEFLAYAVGYNGPSGTAIVDTFSDTAELDLDDKKFLNFALEKGIIRGYGDNTLHPNEPVTRVEFAVMVCNAEKYFTEKPKLVDFAPNYGDIPDWGYDAIAYCMERGFLMGYGDQFGSYDNITVDQANKVIDRLVFGLLTADKYTLLDLYGKSPLNMAKVRETGNNAELAVSFEEGELDSIYNFGWDSTPPTYDTAALAVAHIQDTMDILHTYNSYDTTEEPSIRGRERLDILNNAYMKVTPRIEKEGNRESFFVTAPQNYTHAFYNGWDFYMKCGGYLYFIYHEASPEELPEGVELGRWYRQKVEIRSDNYYPTSGTTFNWNENFSAPGLVPQELLNE